MLYSPDGSVLRSGRGSLAYEPGTGLFSVFAEDSYSYIDRYGRALISIPLMSYMVD